MFDIGIHQIGGRAAHGVNTVVARMGGVPASLNRQDAFLLCYEFIIEQKRTNT